MNTLSSKECRMCGETKPISEFYTNTHRPDGYLNVCKPCHRIRSAEAAKRRQERNRQPLASSGELAEVMVVQELAKYGIPSQRSTRHTANAIYTDVLAWGCVRIEVKSSSLSIKDGRYAYKFSFHPDVSVGENNANLIALIMLDVSEFYVFPFNHPVFICVSNKYGRAGQRKAELSYRVGARPITSPETYLTEQLLNNFKGRWDLVEDYRILHSQMLLRQHNT